MILVNGVAATEIPAMDRGLAYGDGVFRTLRLRNGVPQHWERHYARLARDCAALKLPCTAAPLLRNEVTAVREGHDCAIKMIITRGAGERGYAYTGNSEPMRVVSATVWREYPRAYRETGVSVRLCNLRLAHQPALAGVKHLNRLENVLARAEWNNPDIAEGILCDAEDNAICGTMTNLFLAKGATLFTPRLDRCGVAGVTRDRIVEAAARLNYACVIRDIGWAEVLAADEIFLVNSLAGVWPVRVLAAKVRPVGPMTRALQHALEQEDGA